MLVHGMTLLSFRLFRKHLGNLREFFGQMVHRTLAKKLPVRLWRGAIPYIGSVPV